MWLGSITPSIVIVVCAWRRHRCCCCSLLVMCKYNSLNIDRVGCGVNGCGYRVPGTKISPFCRHTHINSPAIAPFLPPPSPSPEWSVCYALEAVRTRLFCLLSHISSCAIYTVYIVNGVALNCLQSKPIALRCDEGIDCAIRHSYKFSRIHVFPIRYTICLLL